MATETEIKKARLLMLEIQKSNIEKQIAKLQEELKDVSTE